MVFKKYLRGSDISLLMIELADNSKNYVRAKRFVFTINNFDDSDIEKCKAVAERATSMIVGIEHNEGEGTPHLQGYVTFETIIYRGTLSAWLPRAWIDVARGGWKQNWRYCAKEGNLIIEKGHTLDESEKKEIGFDKMYADMKTMTPAQFEETYPKFWLYHRERVMAVMIDHAMQKVSDWGGSLEQKNYWIWGEPGIGKSQLAATQGNYSEIYKKNFNKWWDGYNLMAHKIVILDDYPCLPQGNVLVQHMKIWADRYPFVGESKGSHLMVEPGRFLFIVTSNYPIHECFQSMEDQTAMLRRFHSIHMTNDNKLMLLCTQFGRSILKE